MFLDSKLNFKEHIQNVLNKVSKTIGLLGKLQKILPRPPLITIYKFFIKPHLHYGDIIYNVYKVSFHQKIESNAALVITGAVRETSREKLYHELGFQYLASRKWYIKLCCFYKVFKTQSHRYLFKVSQQLKEPLPHFKVKHNYFKYRYRKLQDQDIYRKRDGKRLVDSMCIWDSKFFGI